MEEDNLWGDFNIEKIETPKSILEQQGDFLTKGTKRKIYGCVNSIEDANLKKSMYVNDKKQFNYEFNLKSDYIPDYSYKLLSIHHDIEIYPLFIELPESIYKEVEVNMMFTADCCSSEQYKKDHNTVVIRNNTIVVDTIDGFKAVLKLILQSEKVKNILVSLISLAN